MSEMILDLSEDAKEYGRQALRAFEAAGGDQLVQQAEAKPDTRDALVGPVLNELGAWELDARTDADGLEAAAALCRSAATGRCRIRSPNGWPGRSISTSTG